MSQPEPPPKTPKPPINWDKLEDSDSLDSDEITLSELLPRLTARNEEDEEEDDSGSDEFAVMTVSEFERIQAGNGFPTPPTGRDDEDDTLENDFRKNEEQYRTIFKALDSGANDNVDGAKIDEEGGVEGKVITNGYSNGYSSGIDEGGQYEDEVDHEKQRNHQRKMEAKLPTLPEENGNQDYQEKIAVEESAVGQRINYDLPGEDVNPQDQQIKVVEESVGQKSVNYENWDPASDQYHSYLNFSQLERDDEPAVAVLLDAREGDAPCKFNDGISGRCWKGNTCHYSHPIAEALPRKTIRPISLKDKLEGKYILATGRYMVGIISHVENISEFFVTLKEEIDCCCNPKDAGAPAGEGHLDIMKTHVGHLGVIHPTEGLYGSLGALKAYNSLTKNLSNTLMRQGINRRCTTYEEDQLIACRVKIGSKGLKWYRGVALESTTAEGAVLRNQLKVQLIDVGIKLSVPFVECCSLPEQFTRVPPLAIRCSLTGLIPWNWKFIQRAEDTFKDLARVDEEVLVFIRCAFGREEQAQHFIFEDPPYEVDLIILNDLSEIPEGEGNGSESPLPLMDDIPKKKKTKLSWSSSVVSDSDLAACNLVVTQPAEQTDFKLETGWSEKILLGTKEKDEVFEKHCTSKWVGDATKRMEEKDFDEDVFGNDKLADGKTKYFHFDYTLKHKPSPKFSFESDLVKSVAPSRNIAQRLADMGFGCLENRGVNELRNIPDILNHVQLLRD